MAPFLILTFGFASAIMLYEESPWKKERYSSSKGCSHAKDFGFLNHLKLGPMQHLSTIDQKVGMWSGSPGNFDAYHLKQNNLMKNMTDELDTSKFTPDTTSSVYGFRVEKSKPLDEPHAFFENERCVFSVTYSAGGWQVSFTKEWLRIHFFEVDVLKRSYPRYESSNAAMSFSFIGPSLLQLDFIPISWGIWWEKKALPNYPVERATFICKGMVSKPDINGIPDGWLAPRITSLLYEMI
ncbi:hypothetical protein DSO57_1021237 [Entomophthora muscae]|uniref:Uncharacterized protein n=1 Tax=Entomophthora muscae TaxID=34485 RepID=A0ACC2UD97_9FUNG|nr:hypothetical protein DSO57_1021237 [Entomophthora muscae]